MPLANFLRDDRVVLTTLALATIGFVTVVKQVLTTCRDDAEIKTPQPKTQYITQDTEDSLELATLETLSDHHNYAIRETAIKIIVDRSVNDAETIDTLLWGITREDYGERMRCLRALAFITDRHTLPKLNTQKAISGFVRSLQLSLGDVEQEKLDDPHFDEYYLRDMAEKLCLMFVWQLVDKYNVEMLIKARFVDKWLAKQYWGDTAEETQKNFSDYMDKKENRIVEIVSKLEYSAAGRRALAGAGLVKKSGRRAREGGRSSNRWSFVLSLHENDDSVPEPRVMEQSVEEQRIRRQHREAMVLNDGSRPFIREDIIQREQDSPS